MLTLEGLRKLVDMKNRGEKLPEGYERDVKEYIKLKEKHIEHLRRILENEEEKFKEAFSLAAALNVDLTKENVARNEESQQVM